jgi:phosphoribosylglycinamide formyltransferase-1
MSDNKRLRVVILASGAGSLAQAVFDAKLDLNILALISDKKSQALEKAKNFGIPAIFLPVSTDRELWNSQIISKVGDLAPDLVVSLGFMRILPKEFVDRFPTINTHPALLPSFPGAHAVRDALAAGVSQTGSTVHWVDEGVDTGKVIAQVPVAISASDTEESLHERIKIAERLLIVETLQAFIANGINGA